MMDGLEFYAYCFLDGMALKNDSPLVKVTKQLIVSVKTMIETKSGQPFI